MEQGTINNPWSATTALEKGLAGDQAIYAIETNQKVKLTEPQKEVVRVEGYVPGFYKDLKGNITKGVGQTGEYINETFVETFNKHQKKAENIMGPLNVYPVAIQSLLMKAVYRGDMAPNHRWVHEFKKGNFEKAAADFLVNNEYLQYKRKGITNGITKRFEDIHTTLLEYSYFVKYKKQGVIK